MVRRRRALKNGAKRRLPSIFGVPCSLFDIPFWLRLWVALRTFVAKKRAKKNARALYTTI